MDQEPLNKQKTPNICTECMAREFCSRRVLVEGFLKVCSYRIHKDEGGAE